MQKTLSPCGMRINATILLVGRTHHNSKLNRSQDIPVQQSHQTCCIHHTFQNRFTCQKVERQWKSRSYTSYKIGTNITTLPELWPLHDILLDSEKDRWIFIHLLTPAVSEGKTLNICAKHIVDCTSWHRILARAELRTKQRLGFCKLPDSPGSSCYSPSTNESNKDDQNYGEFIHGASQHAQLS